MGRREQLEKVSQAPLKDTMFDASRKSRPPSSSQPNRTRLNCAEIPEVAASETGRAQTVGPSGATGL